MHYLIVVVTIAVIAAIVMIGGMKEKKKMQQFLQTGIKGTAKLYRCSCYRHRNTLSKTYEPVISFEYNGEWLFRSPLGSFGEPPCKIGDTIDIIYSPVLDEVRLYKDCWREYGKYHDVG